MARIKSLNLSGVTADDNGIVVSITPSGGGVQSLPIAGQPPKPILISITSSANDSGRTFVITGTDRFGEVMSEIVSPGPNVGAVSSSKQFASITSITVDNNTAGAIIIGWASVVYSPWYMLNTKFVENVEVGLNVVVTGTVNFDLEYTFDDLQVPGSTGGDLEASVSVVIDQDLDGDTASVFKTLIYRAEAIRLKINSGTGSLAAKVAQASNR